MRHSAPNWSTPSFTADACLLLQNKGHSKCSLPTAKENVHLQEFHEISTGRITLLNKSSESKQTGIDSYRDTMATL